MRCGVFLCVLAGLLTGLSAARADDKVEVRELDVKGIIPPGKGDVTKPTEITSADDLAKVASDKDGLETLKKQVNFDKEKVLLFTWQGSGQDKMTASGEKGEVAFKLKPG